MAKDQQHSETKLNALIGWQRSQQIQQDQNNNNNNTNLYHHHHHHLLKWTTQHKHWDHLAQLSCDSGEMILRLNFTEPFKGIVYPDHNRLSACRFFGDGHLNYELRLPLRGCGTRQAASRVFVNDVIVRFHKALELEEDEVKTLICRYPPPLAPSAQTIKTNSLKSSSTTTTTEAGESDQSQFEFVDPQSGRPSNSLSSNAAGEPPGSSGNIETLSENLVVAPSGGHLHNNQQATNQLESLNPYATAPNGNRQQQQLNNRLLVPPSSNANNNDLLFKQRNSFNNLIEPITIDSALPNSPPTTASPSSYFERLSSVELLFLISSLLFLILLALGLVGSLYCFRLRAVVGQNRASAILRRRKRRYVGAIFDQVAAVAPSATLQHHHHYQNQQQYAIAAAAAAAANAHQLPLTAPSSPESDLSGRAGLLAGSSGSMSNQQQAAYLFNRNSHYLSNQQHRHRQSRQQHYNGVHYGNSSKRASNNQLPTTGRRSLQQQQQVAHNQPVVGRREGLYGNAYTNYAAPGRPVARRSSPHRAQHHLYLRPTYLQPELSKSHEPLVTTISGDHEQAIRAHRYGRPVAQQQREASSTLHRAHQVYIDQQQRRNPAQQLWRAKSLSSFPQPVEVGGALSNNRLLSRQTAAIKSGTIAGKHSKRLAQTPEVRRGNSSCSSNDDCDIDHNRSWQRTFERNNNLLELLTREKPKIVLKSIEDSYITKLTEIEEQEYMKRDSTKPLDLATWRAMQPSGQLETGATNEQQQRMNLSSAESSDDEELLEGLASAHTNLRSLTELDVNYVRTLPRPGTPVAQKASSSSPPTTIRASVSADRLLDEPARTHQSAGKAQVNYEQQRRRSNSEPDVTSGAGGGHQSPDLIVSAEYDCSRLELEESHNSVSYV